MPSSNSLQPKKEYTTCLATDDFYKISYTDWGNPQAEKVAICIHGVSRNGRDFDYLAKELSQNGYRVICPDMPGRGTSDWLTVNTDYNMPFLASIAATFLNLFPSKELLWVGTSMGGLLGMFLASRPHTPIKKLILNDIGPELEGQSLKRILNYLSLMPTFKTKDLAKHFLSQILAPFGIKTDEHLEHMTTYSFFKNEQGEYQLAYDPKILTTFQTDDADLWPLWQPIACPTLVLRGQHSTILSSSTFEKMKEKPNVTGVEFPEVGHAPALMEANQIKTICEWAAEKDKG